MNLALWCLLVVIACVTAGPSRAPALEYPASLCVRWSGPYCGTRVGQAANPGPRQTPADPAPNGEVVHRADAYLTDDQHGPWRQVEQQLGHPLRPAKPPVAPDARMAPPCPMAGQWFVKSAV